MSTMGTLAPRRTVALGGTEAAGRACSMVSTGGVARPSRRGTACSGRRFRTGKRR